MGPGRNEEEDPKQAESKQPGQEEPAEPTEMRAEGLSEGCDVRGTMEELLIATLAAKAAVTLAGDGMTNRQESLPVPQAWR